MEGTLRCTLGLQAQHTHIIGKTYTVYPTEHLPSTLNTSITLNNNHTTQYCELFHQTIRNTQDEQIHYQSNTEHTRIITLHSGPRRNKTK